MKSIHNAVWVMAAAVIAVAMVGCGPSEREKKQQQDKADSRKVAQITWKDVNFIDTIQQGDTVQRNFIFYNTGWKPAVVKHAIPSRPECTCAVPTREVPIGEQDTVKLTCIFKDYEPKATVEIIIEHNTPQPEPILIYMAYMNKE
jgi:hypothetical protein